MVGARELLVCASTALHPHRGRPAVLTHCARAWDLTYGGAPLCVFYSSDQLTGGCSSQVVSSQVSSLKMLCNLTLKKNNNNSLANWFIGWTILWEEMTCVHGFPLGGASFYLDRTLWLAKYTSSSFASFVVQLFQVVLMKLSFDQKLTNWKAMNPELMNHKAMRQRAMGQKVFKYFFFFLHRIMLSRWRKPCFFWGSSLCLLRSPCCSLMAAFWGLLPVGACQVLKCAVWRPENRSGFRF